MSFLKLVIVFITFFQCAIAGSSDFSRFVANSIGKSVGHGVVEDLRNRLNATEEKLKNAFNEIEYLKEKDQAITDELGGLKAKINYLLIKCKSTTNTTSTVGDTSTLAPQTKPVTEYPQQTFAHTVSGNQAFADTYLLTSCSMDVIFVLDGSHSIGINNFLLVKQWVKTMAASIQQLDTDIQLGVVQFSHYFKSRPIQNQRFIKTEVTLHNYNYTDFALAVDNIMYMGYTTYTSAALEKVQLNFNQSKNFGKRGNIQIMILVTDGRAEDFATLSRNAAALRNMGIIPIVFGVGDYVVEELRIIATGNTNSSERVNVLEDFTGLKSAVADVKQYLDSCLGSSSRISSQEIAPTPQPSVTLPEIEYDFGCSADVIFVLDGSGSITIPNFARMKRWVAESARHMISINSDTYFGVMVYSRYFPSTPLDRQPFITMEIPLGHHNTSDFTFAVNNIRSLGGSTYTAAALRMVRYAFLNSSRFGQDGNVQIMVLLTDGRATDSHNLAESALDLRNIGVVPLVYGIGNADKAELGVIATGSRNNATRVSMLSDFADLQSADVEWSTYLYHC